MKILKKINFPQLKNFLRNIKKKLENIYHHIGIYIYKVSTLEKFVSLKQSSNELKFKLEQLRALDNNIKIDVDFCKFYTYWSRY